MIEKIYSQPRSRIIALQYISYALTKTYFILSRSSIVAVDEWSVNPRQKHVIASTHVSWLDPFLATTSLGWKRLRPLLPCRFMAHPVFLRKPWLRPIMLWLGSFPSHPFDDMAYGLEAAHSLLDQNQTIVMFPQGKRNREDKKVHRGVAELAAHPGTYIVPVLIHKQGKFMGMPSYLIYTGQPFEATGLSAEEIMARVFELGPALKPSMA